MSSNELLTTAVVFILLKLAMQEFNNTYFACY